jgi:hypothetical protein
MWGFVGKCGDLWGFVGKCGVCGETHALRILGSYGENEKKEKVIWPIRASPEHPKSGNLCENVSLLQVTHICIFQMSSKYAC